MIILIGYANADLIDEANTAFIRGDYPEAVRLFKYFSKAGNSIAQNNLGIMCDVGLGVTQDHTQAAHWYFKATVQGNAAAQGNLGLLYEKGNGVTQSYSKATNWYRKAAEQGLAPVQLFLGLLFLRGKGVSQDYVEAFEWLNLAADADVSGAAEVFDFVAKRLTKDKRTKAQRLSQKWLVRNQ